MSCFNSDDALSLHKLGLKPCQHQAQGNAHICVQTPVLSLPILQLPTQYSKVINTHVAFFHGVDVLAITQGATVIIITIDYLITFLFFIGMSITHKPQSPIE